MQNRTQSRPRPNKPTQPAAPLLSIGLDLSRCRIIDLSLEVLPGERKINGEYRHGIPPFGRPAEVQEFIAYGARMHFIQSQTHMGTHLEAAYKYFENGTDVGALPLESVMGEAVACNFTAKPPGAAITVADFQRAGVKPGDIVLLWAREFKVDKAHRTLGATGNAAISDEQLQRWVYVEEAAMDWLIKLPIKMLAMENLLLSPCGTPYGKGDADWKLHGAGIPIVDCVVGLDQLTQPRVFFMALAPKLRRVTATWCRALAFEPR